MQPRFFVPGLVLLAIAGCSEGTMEAEKAAPGVPSVSASAPSVPLVGPADTKLTTDEVQEIEGLKDPEDRKLALAQKVCPVGYKEGSGHLGTMGAPVKKVVNGQTVFLCCGSCAKAIEGDPAKYLAKFPSK